MMRVKELILESRRVMYRSRILGGLRHERERERNSAGVSVVEGVKSNIPGGRRRRRRRRTERGEGESAGRRRGF